MPVARYTIPTTSLRLHLQRDWLVLPCQETLEGFNTLLQLFDLILCNFQVLFLLLQFGLGNKMTGLCTVITRAHKAFVLKLPDQVVLPSDADERFAALACWILGLRSQELRSLSWCPFRRVKPGFEWTRAADTDCKGV